MGDFYGGWIMPSWAGDWKKIALNTRGLLFTGDTDLECNSSVSILEPGLVLPGEAFFASVLFAPLRVISHASGRSLVAAHAKAEVNGNAPG